MAAKRPVAAYTDAPDNGGLAALRVGDFIPTGHGEIFTAEAGRKGKTGDGKFYRMIDGSRCKEPDIGIPVPLGTLIHLSWTRKDSAAATLEILVGGVIRATLLSSASGRTANDSLSVDTPAGVCTFRNESGGNETKDVQILAIFRRR